MNITELARKLKIPTTELKEKLPELGFDIGMRAIKVPDRMAQEIIHKWTQEEKRQRLEDKVLAEKEKKNNLEKSANKIFYNIREALKENIDAVIISSPSSMHINQAINFLDFIC